MKIGIVQARPVAGDIAANIAGHLAMVEQSAGLGAEAVVFPELSLTGYEPGLAGALAMSTNDSRLDAFRRQAEARQVTIGVGAPLRVEGGVAIGMCIFRPGADVQVYAKQHLHADELPYFVGGTNTDAFIRGTRIAPAICFEVSVATHAASVARAGAEAYVASVAKTASGVDAAMPRLASIARQYSIPVLMANAVGAADGAGCSAAWNAAGERLAMLDGENEGMLIVDTVTQQLLHRLEAPALA